MIIERIHSFSSALLAAQEHPVIMSFRVPSGQLDNKNEAFEFTIANHHIYYNHHLKNFPSICTDYLTNTMALKIQSGTQPQVEPVLFLSLPQIINHTVNTIPDATINLLFPDISSLVLAGTNNNLPSEGQPARLQIIQSLLLYHRYAPKPLINFISDFPLMNQTEILRSVLYLSLLNHLQLRNTAENVHSTPEDDASNQLTYISGNPLRKPATTPRIGGLQKILNSIKKL